MKALKTSFYTQGSQIKKLCRIFCITFSLLSFLFTTPSVFSQNISQESTNSKNTDQKLDQVKQAISEQKHSIKQVNSTRRKLIQQLKSDDIAIAVVVKDLTTTNKKITQSKTKISQLKKQQKTLNQEKNQQESILAKQLRAAYSTGHHDYLKLILNQRDPKEVQRTITYYRYLNDARMKEIGQYQATIKELTGIVNQQQQQTKQYQKLQSIQQEQKSKLSNNKNQRKKTITALNKQLRNSKQQLEQLESEEANLIAAIARLIELNKQEVGLNGLSRLKRKLSWPINAKINRSFGSRKQGYLKWKGVLMNAPVGQQVKTIHNGKILFSDWLKGYGLVTIVDHGKGYMSLYGHNQALLKSVGDRVETGEPIALVGQSGGQSKPALYFEIRHNGRAVNPKLWCR